MNCKEVQDALWAGLNDAEVQKHLADCSKCREEWAMLQEIGEIMERTDIPVPERTLVPSERQIESIMGEHRRRRWARWAGVGTGVAAACVALAVVVSPGLFNSWQQANTPPLVEPAPQQTSEQNPPKPTEQTNPTRQMTEQEQIQAAQTAADKLLAQYGFTRADTYKYENTTLPATFTMQEVGELPHGLYWSYFNVLAKDVKLDLTPALGQSIRLHHVPLKQPYPQAIDNPMTSGRTIAYIAEQGGTIRGAWIGKENTDMYGSLTGRAFGDLFRGSWDEYVAQAYQPLPTGPDVAPEVVIQNFFATLTSQPGTSYAQLTNYLKLNLYSERPASWSETSLPLSLIQKAGVPQIRLTGEYDGSDMVGPDASEKLRNRTEGAIKGYEVIVNLSLVPAARQGNKAGWIEGENVLTVSMIREGVGEQARWKIDYIKGAH